MLDSIFYREEISIQPFRLALHVPPSVWKGDRLGHIGEKHVFFFVVEGNCFLSIDSKSCVVHAGQLAFLPKGQRRAYTQMSEPFIMYEVAFATKVNGIDLMEALGLCSGDFVVDVENIERMKSYFENSSRDEMQRDPLYDINWCANIMNIIKEYAEENRKKRLRSEAVFESLITYMKENLDREIKNEELAATVFMETTYFIRRFKKAYGLPPHKYLANLRINRAAELLATSAYSIDSIAKSVGISDVSYFSRMFKKHSGITPTAYRAAFSP